MIKEAIGGSVSISLMSQYFPAFEVVDNDKLGGRITKEEYQKVVKYMCKLGFSKKNSFF